MQEYNINNQGFTLIQVSIGMTVLAVVAASVPLGSEQNTIVYKTEHDLEKMNRIAKALNDYRALHGGALPCPGPVVDVYAAEHLKNMSLAQVIFSPLFFSTAYAKEIPLEEESSSSSSSSSSSGASSSSSSSSGASSTSSSSGASSSSSSGTSSSGSPVVGRTIGAPGACDGTRFSTAEVAGGGLPVYDLFLAAEDGVDSFGQTIKYFVAKSATLPSNCADPGFAAKDIIIRNQGTGGSLLATTHVLLLSTGRDAHGAWLKDGTDFDSGSTDPDTLANANLNNIFVVHPPTPGFDDVAMYSKPTQQCAVQF